MKHFITQQIKHLPNKKSKLINKAKRALKSLPPTHGPSLAKAMKATLQKSTVGTSYM